MTGVVVDMTDGGKVGIDKVTSNPKISRSNYPNILYAIAGGVTSHSSRSKIRANWFLKKGYPNVYIVNRRCSSRVPQFSPQISVPYGKYNDLVDIMDFLTQSEPDKKWILVGSCFGASHVIEYFMQPSSDRPEILGGVVDSFLFNGRKFSSNQLTSKTILATKARELMFKMLVDSALNHAADKEVYDRVSQIIDRKQFEDLNFADVKSSESIVELFRAMCPEAGFVDWFDIYSKTSPYFDMMPYHQKNFLKITKPLVMVYAQDDPFSPFDSEEVELVKENPNLCLWLYPGGGHVSFAEKVYPYKSYLEDFYLENCSLIRKLS